MMADHFFNRAVAHTKLTAHSIAIGRKVLVKGWAQADAAKWGGVTQPRVSAICSVVLRARPMRPPPENWVKVDVTVPPDLAKAMRQAARDARAELKASRKRPREALSGSDEDAHGGSSPSGL